MPMIEIRDPALDQGAIRQQLQSSIDRRLAMGGYGPNPALLGPESLRSPLVIPTDASESEFSALDEALLSLATHTELSETHFTSNVPMLGPFIVAVRRWWNWMSTKWYVLPVLQQQSQINARMSLILDSLAHWQTLNTKSLARLQARVTELETRLEKLENR